MTGTKLVDDISFEQEDKEYNLVEVFVNLNNSDTSISSDKKRSPTQLLAETLVAAIHQTIENTDAIDKLCTPCIKS